MNPTRRELLACAAASAVTTLSGTASVAGRSPARPNVLFILADDLGAFDLSCYGRDDLSTPNIDRLATEGIRFSSAYANSSTCTPSRVALISGRYQNRVEVGTGLGGGYTSNRIGYPSDLPSIARLFQDNGYRTALVGKWDLGEPPAFGPIRSGYQEFFGFMGGALDYWTHDLALPSSPAIRRPDLYENEKPVAVEGYATDLFTGRAVEFVSRSTRQPFFLSLHFSAPHWPWQTRDDHGEPRVSDFHYDGGSAKIFASMVQEMDKGIGRILDALKSAGKDANTIIVFTSDNGGERFSKMWPLRGSKGELWEGGIRVPLVVRWAEKIRPAQSSQVTLSMDFLPTLASMAGLAVPDSYLPDGLDISPQLYGAEPIARTVFWKTPGEWRAAISYPWKYVQKGKFEYLYNLEVDPSERANFRLSAPDRFEDLKQQMDAWSDTVLPDMQTVDPSILDYLEALQPPARR